MTAKVRAKPPSLAVNASKLAWPNVQLAFLLRPSRTNSRCLLCAPLLQDAKPAICGSWERRPFSAKEAATARVMMVGEQPGDKEDLQGRPFVGPAGAVLDKALVAAGIERKDVYLTNIVKHFKWEPRGKRRLHRKPNALKKKNAPGWKPRSMWLSLKWWCCWAPLPHRAIMGSQFRVTQAARAVGAVEHCAAGDGHRSSIIDTYARRMTTPAMRKCASLWLDLRRVATQIKALRAA